MDYKQICARCEQPADFACFLVAGDAEPQFSLCENCVDEYEHGSDEWTATPLFDEWLVIA